MTAQVVATGFARFGRRPEPLVQLAAEAVRGALESIGRAPIDLLVVGNMLGGAVNHEENLVSRIANVTGLETAAGLRVEAASASGAAAFQAAVLAVESGRYDRAVVVAVEKMTDRPTADVATALAASLHPTEQAAGATMPGLAALVTQLYCDRYGADLGAMDRVSVAARQAALSNPFAQFTSPVTEEEVRQSRPIAGPLRLLHCSAISDGAVAVVVERGDGPARVAGMGQGLEAMALIDRGDLTTFAATRTAGERAFLSARRSPRQVQVAELHDAFAPFLWIDLEDLGFAGPGTAWRWFGDAPRPDGAPTVNPSGGLLGRGHPVGASGLAAIAEVARQVRGEAGSAQVDPRPTLGLAQSIGGLASHNFVTLLEGGDA